MITRRGGYRVAMPRTAFAAAIVGMMALSAFGCRSTPGLDDASDPSTAASPSPTGPFSPEPLATPPEPMVADVASVEVVDRVELLAWESSGPSGRRRMLVERSGPEAGQTVWRVDRTLLERVGGGADERTPIRSDTYTRAADGSVAITEETNHDENVEVVFEPPMVVMPGRLVAGAPFEQKFDVRVYPGGKGRKMLKSSGPGSHTIELTGLWRVTLAGGGTVEARGVRSVFRADFNPARVVNTTEQWFVEGVGVIAERRHERTTVFGLPIRESSETWAARSLSEPPARAGGG